MVESCDKGHSKRGQLQTSQQRTSRNCTLLNTLYRKSPLEEDNFSTKDTMLTVQWNPVIVSTIGEQNLVLYRGVPSGLISGVDSCY